MTFGLSAGAIAAIGAMTAATAGSQIYAANKQAKATKAASKVQAKASNDALRQQTQEMNQANQKTADTESLLEQNTGSDVQGTMLTGANGIQSLDDLILGRGASMLGGRK